MDSACTFDFDKESKSISVIASVHSPKNLMLGLLILIPHGINITNVAVPVYSDA